MELIALKGLPNSNKTTILTSFYSVIKDRYSVREVYFQELGKFLDDFVAVFLIGDIVCGIITEGDYGDDAFKHLSLYQRLVSLKGCDIIICACSKKKTVSNPEVCLKNFVGDYHCSLKNIEVAHFRNSLNNQSKIKDEKTCMIDKLSVEFDKKLLSLLNS